MPLPVNTPVNVPRPPVNAPNQPVQSISAAPAPTAPTVATTTAPTTPSVQTTPAISPATPAGPAPLPQLNLQGAVDFARTNNAASVSGVLDQINNRETGLVANALRALPRVSAERIAAPKAIVADKVVAVERQVDRANDTVSGQLKQVLDENSPLLRQAAQTGIRQANARGLINSTIAGEAAQAAVYDRAQSIATSDASTYFQQGTINQNFKNQAQQLNVANKLQADSTNVANQIRVAEANAANALAASIQNAGNATAVIRDGLQASTNAIQTGLQSDFAVIQQAVGTGLNAELGQFNAAINLNMGIIAGGVAGAQSLVTGAVGTLQTIAADPALSPAQRAEAAQFVVTNTQYGLDALAQINRSYDATFPSVTLPTITPAGTAPLPGATPSPAPASASAPTSAVSLPRLAGMASVFA